MSHVDLGILGLFSTFNGSLRLAFPENISKQVSFVLGLIDQAQWAEEGSLAVGIKVGVSMCVLA